LSEELNIQDFAHGVGGFPFDSSTAGEWPGNFVAHIIRRGIMAVVEEDMQSRFPSAPRLRKNSSASFATDWGDSHLNVPRMSEGEFGIVRHSFANSVHGPVMLTEPVALSPRDTEAMPDGGLSAVRGGIGNAWTRESSMSAGSSVGEQTGAAASPKGTASKPTHYVPPEPASTWSSFGEEWGAPAHTPAPAASGTARKPSSGSHSSFAEEPQGFTKALPTAAPDAGNGSTTGFGNLDDETWSDDE